MCASVLTICRVPLFVDAAAECRRDEAKRTRGKLSARVGYNAGTAMVGSTESEEARTMAWLDVEFEAQAGTGATGLTKDFECLVSHGKGQEAGRPSRFFHFRHAGPTTPGWRESRSQLEV